MSVPTQKPELIVKIEQLELGQERNNPGAQSRGPVAAYSLQQRGRGRGQCRIGVETRNDPTHQFVIPRRPSRCRGTVTIRSAGTRGWFQPAPVTECGGRSGWGDDF